jgi:hypothetical protein
MMQADFVAAGRASSAASRVLNGIDNVLYIADPLDPDYGVWRRAIKRDGTLLDVGRYEWINYAPQMLDVPAKGVGSALVGDWIHRRLQASDGAVLTNTTNLSRRKSPGLSFQASLAWLDLGQTGYAGHAQYWAKTGGLWQLTPDGNHVVGGWIDWIEPLSRAQWWERFIDTSFYAIAAYQGGYDFAIHPHTLSYTEFFFPD